MTSPDRIFTAHLSSSSAGELLFRSLTGHEAISELFEFEVTLLSPSGTIDLKTLLGQSMTIEISEVPATPRYLNGIITRMALSGREDSGERYYRYQATLQPGLWYATQNRDFRIFQEKTVPEILTSVLGGYQIKVDNRLSYDYRAWSYCVQYQESDFTFLSRLMEHEGIYYYFTHQEDGHTLVLADAPQGHDTLPGYPAISYRLPECGLTDDEGNIQSWQISDSITASQLSVDDYDFRKPRAQLLDTRQNPVSHAQDKAQVFEWPGGYIDADEGQFYTRVRQQEQEARHEMAHGTASSLGLAPGYIFTLRDAPRPEDERSYLTVQARYFFQENAYASLCDDLAEHRTEFKVVPAAVNWRPLRTTLWPKTNGPQTAEVVGPAGESIWTDKYGRVKLKFRWDRYASGDETSSCWIRVSSAWAGWKYGAIQIPRVGEEVVVDFINGDPDRPLITGRVYNEDNMPPWDLPAAATKMGITTRTKDGNATTANYMSFEDAPGLELVDIHAERDMEVSVEKDFRHTVGLNSTTDIGVNKLLTVGSAFLTNVGAAMATNVGAAKATNVGAAMVTNIGLGNITNIGLANITTIGLGNITTVGGLMTTNVGGAMTTAVIGPYIVLSPFITIG